MAQTQGSARFRLDWGDVFSAGRHAITALIAAASVLQPTGPADPEAEKAALLAGAAAAVRLAWRFFKDQTKAK